VIEMLVALIPVAGVMPVTVTDPAALTGTIMTTMASNTFRMVKIYRELE